MYELDRARKPQPVTPSLFLAAVLLAAMWLAMLASLLETIT